MGVTVTLSQQSLTTTHAQARNHEVLIDRPAGKGGTDLGMMGGEMLLVALGGCFMSNLLEAVRTRAAAISNIKTEVEGNLVQSPARFGSIEMRVSAETADLAQLEKLVTIAERACICANTLRGGTELNVTVAAVEPA